MRLDFFAQNHMLDVQHIKTSLISFHSLTEGFQLTQKCTIGEIQNLIRHIRSMHLRFKDRMVEGGRLRPRRQFDQSEIDCQSAIIV